RAIGEVGMDLYWDRTYRDEQMQALELQAQRAVELDLPLVIHCREALDETLEVLRGVRGARGVMHSFGGTEEDVDKVRRELGDDWYFGINGIVTFKNCRVADALPAITAARLLLETDSPYLAPVPHRGKRNESAYIAHTARRAAEALGMPPVALADATFDNACRLLRI
ncbi:MAG: TatD family hydrolase, partial [Muribaculaceae bacterium]|nr:TatD family hydrolase [Muribaculaceae bacterium]